MSRMIEGLLLRLVAALIGVRVTSWHRTEAENTAVGGVANSQHLGWSAIDVGYESPEWARQVLRLFAKEVVEGQGAAHSTGPHYHYEADGRGWRVLLAACGVVVAGIVAGEKGGA